MYRILVVDDEPSICKALSMGLASDEFAVDVASDGNKGILLGARKKYDILIVDLCLPDIYGLKVIEKIKLNSPEIISIIITGNINMESSIEAIRLGVSDYIEKPLDLKTIKDAIAKALQETDLKQKTVRKKM